MSSAVESVEEKPTLHFFLLFCFFLSHAIVAFLLLPIVLVGEDGRRAFCVELAHTHPRLETRGRRETERNKVKLIWA